MLICIGIIAIITLALFLEGKYRWFELFIARKSKQMLDTQPELTDLQIEQLKEIAKHYVENGIIRYK